MRDRERENNTFVELLTFFIEIYNIGKGANLKIKVQKIVGSLYKRVTSYGENRFLSDSH